VRIPGSRRNRPQFVVSWLVSVDNILGERTQISCFGHLGQPDIRWKLQESWRRSEQVTAMFCHQSWNRLELKSPSFVANWLKMLSSNCSDMTKRFRLTRTLLNGYRLPRMQPWAPIRTSWKTDQNFPKYQDHALKKEAKF
jgi:hypothetical protein